MTDQVKTTALNPIANNLSYTSILPITALTGTPTTYKGNIQVVGNMVLAGAGGANFVPAAVATLSYTVANAAQANITSVGTLTSLTVSGNLSAGNAALGNLASASFFSGNGNGLSGLAVANVVGIGNIATINRDGNASNVLLGSGTFGATPLNSNVVQLVAEPVSNVAAGTTGQIAFDSGGNLFFCVATNSWSKIAGSTTW